jgi:hypothetical protein
LLNVTGQLAPVFMASTLSTALQHAFPIACSLSVMLLALFVELAGWPWALSGITMRPFFIAFFYGIFL